MKKIKKVLSVLLAMCMVFAVTASFASAKTEDKTLKFNENGEFKIMQIADIQDRDNIKSVTLMFLEDVIKEVQPDLVVLTGDNIGSSTKPVKKALKAIDKYMSVFEKLDVKVAAVFGNHDDENTPATKEIQMAKYMEYSCFVGCPGDENIAGVGNYNLPVLSSDGSKVAFNVWCFDSGNYNDENDLGGYGCVHKDQIEWYKATSSALTAANGGVPVPALAFQHIIVPEIYNHLVEVEAGTAGSINEDGKSYVLPEYAVEGSVMREAPCPPKYNNGQYAAMAEQGDILATVAGHDHINNFIIPCEDGPDIICTSTAGFRSYGDDNRGVRVFTVNENTPGEYKTETVRFLDFYANNELALTMYKLYAPESSNLVKVVSFVKVVVYKVKAFFGK